MNNWRCPGCQSICPPSMSKPMLAACRRHLESIDACYHHELAVHISRFVLQWMETSFADPDGVQRTASARAEAVAALTGHPVPASGRPSKAMPGGPPDVSTTDSHRTSLSPDASSRQAGRESTGGHRCESQYYQ